MVVGMSGRHQVWMIRRETYSATNRRYTAAAAIQNEDPCLTYMQKKLAQKNTKEKKDLSNAYFFAF